MENFRMGKLLETRTLLDFFKTKEKPKLKTVNYDETVEKAIMLMIENKYSQLPVIKKEKVVGVISYESIANSLFNFLSSKRTLPSEFRVDDLMEKSPIYSNKDDMLGLLDTLANRAFALIRNENKVTDIITSYDALQYFRTYGEDFLLLNDIEHILRKNIEAKFDPCSFSERADKIFSYKTNFNTKPPKTIDEMEFGDYTVFISSNWESFHEVFGDRVVFQNYMERTRIIRNNLCHFNGSITISDRVCLKSFFNWLEYKTCAL